MTTNDSGAKVVNAERDSYPRSAEATLTFATHIEAAYFKLREDILSSTLRPGDKLRLDKLRKDYGFGISTLREALSKLSSEKLVRTTGQRGFWVEPISREEFDDITDMRLYLEPEALRRSIRNAADGWAEQVTVAFQHLQEVEKVLDQDWNRLSKAWEEKNRSFHYALIKGSASPWLTRFVVKLSEQSERYRRMAVARHAVPKEVLMAEHEAIYNATISRKERLAPELLRDHITNSANSLSFTLFPRSPKTGR